MKGYYAIPIMVARSDARKYLYAKEHHSRQTSEVRMSFFLPSLTRRVRGEHFSLPI